MLLFMSDINEPQQPLVGDEPLLVLPVKKFRHGEKLEISEAVQAVEICPLTEIIERVDNIAMSWKTLKPSMTSERNGRLGVMK